MQQEQVIRLGFFFGILLLMAGAERLAPRRVPRTGRLRRWINNLGIVVLDSLLVRALLPVLPVAMAVAAQERGVGLLNHGDLPYWLSVVVAVVVLDGVIYLQHVVFHSMPTLWRIHMMHHADLDFDLTTGLRFHPIEIFISTGIKLTAVYALGPPPAAVVLFEVILNGLAMFNHSNFRLPLSLDRVLRLFVVTPDMHRVHHSVIVGEMNSNFGFNLAVWDRLFRTYQAQPRDGHEKMAIGMGPYRNAQKQDMGWMLLLPFTGKRGEDLNNLRRKRKGASRPTGP